MIWIFWYNEKALKNYKHCSNRMILSQRWEQHWFGRWVFKTILCIVLFYNIFFSQNCHLGWLHCPKNSSLTSGKYRPGSFDNRPGTKKCKSGDLTIRYKVVLKWFEKWLQSKQKPIQFKRCWTNYFHGQCTLSNDVTGKSLKHLEDVELFILANFLLHDVDKSTDGVVHDMTHVLQLVHATKKWDCFLTRFIISKTWTKEWVTSLKTDLNVGDKIDRTSFQRWPLIPTRVSMTGLTSINIFGRFAKFEKSLIRTWRQENYLKLNIIQLSEKSENTVKPTFHLNSR